MPAAQAPLKVPCRRCGALVAKACASDCPPAAGQIRRVRGFYQQSRAWHWPASKLPGESENFSIGIYHVDPDDGCEYEFSIRLARLDDSQCAWSIRIFDESWRALDEFADVFSRLAALGEETTAEKIRCVFTDCGVVDLTKARL